MSTFAELGSYSKSCYEAWELLEISEDNLRRIPEFGDDKSQFTSIGEICLSGTDVRVHAGVKTRVGDPVERVAQELYLGDQLLTRFPARSLSLPRIIMPLAEEDGYFMGIITEDWTKDGAHSLEEDRRWFRGLRVDRDVVPDGLYRDVYDALDGRVYPEAFGHAIGRIAGKEVMVDFNEIAYPPRNLDAYLEISSAMTIYLS